MSLGDGKVPKKEAKKTAEKELRLKIGNLPHLGDIELETGNYTFPIMIGMPRVVFEKTAEGLESVNVHFISDYKVGEITVNSQTGEIVEMTDQKTVEDRINNHMAELEEAVQKALIKTAAEELSLLPYPKHRQTPVIEVLSGIILNEEIEERKVRGLKSNYESHINTLLEADLVKRSGHFLEADNQLKQIMRSNSSPSDRLNEAMAYLFRENAENLEMMNEYLGPYLDIAGYYYRRAIESGSLPVVTYDEFQDVASRRMSGKKGDLREFQVARYLIQLEQIGLLEVTTLHGDRAWTGDKNVKENMFTKGGLDQYEAFS